MNGTRSSLDLVIIAEASPQSIKFQKHVVQASIHAMNSKSGHVRVHHHCKNREDEWWSIPQAFIARALLSQTFSLASPGEPEDGRIFALQNKECVHTCLRQAHDDQQEQKYPTGDWQGDDPGGHRLERHSHRWRERGYHLGVIRPVTQQVRTSQRNIYTLSNIESMLTCTANY